MIYKSTKLITEAFDRYDVEYSIIEDRLTTIVKTAFSVEMGPDTIVQFISQNDNNDITVRVNLIYRVPKSKRAEALEACNKANRRFRFLKFYLEIDGDIHADVDIPHRIDDGCLGECCYELFERYWQTIQRAYPIFIEALYKSAESVKNDNL